jgi:hypothetical protein
LRKKGCLHSPASQATAGICFATTSIKGTQIMNAFSRLALSALVATAALAGVHSSAMADTTHGAVCKPYGNSATTGLYSYGSGAYNYAGSSLGVICPLTRSGFTPASGYGVWVDGTTGSSTSTIYCSLTSYNYNGSYVGGTSFSFTGGTFDKYITLTQAQVPYYASLSLYCSVPYGGGIFSIHPQQ